MTLNGDTHYPGSQQTEPLTVDEHEACDLLGKAAALYTQIVGHGPSRSMDLAEFHHHIHVCQQAVMSQAAARAYPHRYRLLGETLRVPGAGPA